MDRIQILAPRLVNREVRGLLPCGVFKGCLCNSLRGCSHTCTAPLQPDSKLPSGFADSTVPALSQDGSVSF